MLVPSLRVGSGVASFAIAYFRKISHVDIQLDFACYKKIRDDYAKEIENAGGQVFYLPPVKKIGNHIKECEKILKENHYDIIHDCSLINTIPMMLVAKQYVAVRILHSHSSSLGETKLKSIRNLIFLPLLRSCFNQYAGCSDLAAKALFGKRKYQLIPNVIDSTKFDLRIKTRKKLRAGMNVDKKIIVGSIGRAASPKNPFRALSIFKEVHRRYYSSEYWWIGNGPLLEELKEYAVRLGISDCVRFLGNRSDVADLYQAIDIFFMPSKFEGLPVACIEAQATGLPCIISSSVTKTVDFTGLIEYIPLTKDNEYWAKKIIHSFSMLDNRRSFKNELLTSLFSDVTAGERLEKYYKDIVYTSDLN